VIELGNSCPSIERESDTFEVGLPEPSRGETESLSLDAGEDLTEPIRKWLISGHDDIIGADEPHA